MSRKNSRIWMVLLTTVFFFAFGTGGFAAEGQAKTQTVQVNENARIEVQIVDNGGRTVAPGQPIGNIQYIVTNKPEGAKVSVSTAEDGDLESKGKLVMAFSCDKPGTVEIQTYVRLAEKAKYYTGTQTIQVTETKPTSRTTVILSIGSKQMIVNNGVVQMDAAPVIRDGRTYVPLRALGDIFGAQCSYDTETGQILVRKAVSQNEQTTVVLTVGASTYQRNGETDTMDAPAYIVNGRTMVPVRFVAEALGIVLKPTYTESGAVADILFQM